MTLACGPPPWSVDDPDPKLGRQCFIVRGHNGQALACAAGGPRSEGVLPGGPGAATAGAV
jgi:hypothetical protein